jgi:hypothetical protein
MYLDEEGYVYVWSSWTGSEVEEGYIMLNYFRSSWAGNVDEDGYVYVWSSWTSSVDKEGYVTFNLDHIEPAMWTKKVMFTLDHLESAAWTKKVI